MAPARSMPVATVPGRNTDAASRHHLVGARRFWLLLVHESVPRGTLRIHLLRNRVRHQRWGTIHAKTGRQRIHVGKAGAGKRRGEKVIVIVAYIQGYNPSAVSTTEHR